MNYDKNSDISRIMLPIFETLNYFHDSVFAFRPSGPNEATINYPRRAGSTTAVLAWLDFILNKEPKATALYIGYNRSNLYEITSNICDRIRFIEPDSIHTSYLRGIHVDYIIIDPGCIISQYKSLQYSNTLYNICTKLIIYVESI